MDAETKQYLDGRFAEMLAAINAWSSRLEHPSDAPVGGADAVRPEREERLISLEDRFRTMELRMAQLVARVVDRLEATQDRLRYLEDRSKREVHGIEDRLDRMDRRLEQVERRGLGVHGRIDRARVTAGR